MKENERRKRRKNETKRSKRRITNDKKQDNEDDSKATKDEEKKMKNPPRLPNGKLASIKTGSRWRGGERADASCSISGQMKRDLLPVLVYTVVRVRACLSPSREEC